jgi:hypothetical protein
LGFGTYNWLVVSPIDILDPSVVLGFFPYGPPQLGPDGTNEIDIEYSRWSQPSGTNGGFTIYPPHGSTIGHRGFNFKLSGTWTTSRFVWSENKIQFFLMGGHQSIRNTTNVIYKWEYSPSSPKSTIPQEPMPLHINLWLDRGRPPTDRQPVDVVLQNFEYMAE